MLDVEPSEGLWALQGSFNDALRGVHVKILRAFKIELKSMETGRGTHFFPSTNPSEGFGLFNQPLRGVGGPTVAGPRAEGAGGKVNLPPSLTYYMF